ncbi:MAG: polysaccharide biosynthesis tyrosine autokinase [Chitinophagaceae bacterium]|nr:polysaccharide biosynthesis tyrosine autokinase [Chitinophagaceae bacterium]
MDEEKDLFSEKTSKGLSIKEIALKYLSHYPLFIISLVVCLGVAFLYLRYTVPKYKASTLIMVKGNQPSASQQQVNDLVGAAMSSQLQGNLNNELISLRSTSLMQKVVSKNGFNISYYHLGKFLKTDLYLDAPLRLIPSNILDSLKTFEITTKKLNNVGGIIDYGTVDEPKSLTFRWNKTFTINGSSYILSPVAGATFDLKNSYSVRWVPIWAASSEISSKMGISILSEKSSILQLEILIENVTRGKDILNAFVKEYDLSDIEDRNLLSQSTIRFINERLGLIAGELSGVEGNLENYQSSNQIIDMGAQSGQAFGNSNDASQSLQTINVKQNIAKMLTGYFTGPDADDKLVPSTMGLDDPTLSALISSYNELQLKRQKESAFATKNSITLKDINNQLVDVKGSILEAINNVNKNLRLQESSFQQQNSQNKRFLSSLPRKERMMQEIKRKQSITEGLYLYLLQKREESAITSTSASLSNYKQIDPAWGYGPVEPNSTNIKLYAGLLGLLLPIGFVYLRDMMNDKITSRDDISKKLPVPVLGDIGHEMKGKLQGFSVTGRDIIAEQFRIIRTALSLMKSSNKQKQVILVTSSAGGEGKSFVSTNLAAVLAIPGRKVALLEFDLRKPGILKTLNIESNVPGITTFIKGKSNNISELYIEIEEIPSLHIYPSGPIPGNPGDLLINERVEKFFEALKKEYEYIIIDTAPAGLVSDCFILGEYADISLYVIRQRVTLKKQLDFINDIFRTGKLRNMALVLNDVKTGGKYGYYGYGGGYGYESYIEPEKKKKRKFSLT